MWTKHAKMTTIESKLSIAGHPHLQQQQHKNSNSNNNNNNYSSDSSNINDLKSAADAEDVERCNSTIESPSTTTPTTSTTELQHIAEKSTPVTTATAATSSLTTAKNAPSATTSLTAEQPLKPPLQPPPQHRHHHIVIGSASLSEKPSKTDASAAAAAAAAAAASSVQIGVSRRTVFGCGATALVVCICLASVAWIGQAMGWALGWEAYVVAALAVIGASGVWHWCGRWLYIAAVTVRRDATGVLRYVRLLYLVHTLQKSNATIGDIFERQVARHPDKPCFVCDGRTWTFREVNDFANRIANLFLAAGFKAGDVVGLLMENRPEFVAIWVGLSKCGIVVPLINTNLRQAALLHSLTVANCAALVYGESCGEACAELQAQLPATLAMYQFDETSTTFAAKVTGARDLRAAMRTTSADKVPQRDAAAAGDRHHSKLLYIYTSGTTGLPKAAVISHSRYVFIAAGIHYIGNMRVSDVYYTPLPLYHTAGGVMSVGQALLFGSTVVLRKKFSASNYFVDCAAHKCTVAQYIGEMCRYMLATKPSAADRAHNVRAIFGNGLRPQIWPQFVERFGIPNVAEFYGATEGNANIVNIDNTVGAIGFVSRIIPSVYPISIIRADPDTGEPIRGPNGLCQLCAPNEPGVFIGKIIPNNPSRAFLGYVDRKASSKKVVHDVFARGDSAFLSGDVLVADERGYLFFKDRTGDTFRWKGENVSTSEVEAQVSNVAEFRDTVVYGVEIPHLEGRAGMAAIVDEQDNLNVADLAAGVRKVLPVYARPQFVRLLNRLDMTGTFKLKKLDLQKDGFNPATVMDKMYYLTSKGEYERLTVDAYEAICRGEIRL